MTPLDATLDLPTGLTREFLLQRQLAPRRRDADGTLIVAAAPGAALEELEELGSLYGGAATAEPATREEVEQLIERLAAGEAALGAWEAPAADDATSDARNLASQPPVIRFVNLLIREASDAGASDIHLEAARAGLAVRFRLDGVLVPAPEPTAGMHLAVTSRIKLLAQLDVAERRRPQDGRIRIRLENREIDLRVSTVPTLHGESVVLRLLERGERPAALADLGLAEDVHQAFRSLAGRPHGMIIATGPTGSGKTTTLYAALAERPVDREKVITVEDPIEYQLPGVTQVPVRRESGTSFATALRALLRQDPDVLMIGEMRDGETAELAIQAAMTGHLVFSTLHTNGALSAVPRLLDLGIPAYLVAATVDGILAQRLVRVVCGDCAESYQPEGRLLRAVDHGGSCRASWRRGRGCRACRGTGYRGRVGLFELLVVSDEFRDAVAADAPLAELARVASRFRMRPMREDGLAKARAGVTTVEEVLRVVH